MKLTIINGPNLNLLGEREKDKYGKSSLEEIKKNCLSFSNEHNINQNILILILNIINQMLKVN